MNARTFASSSFSRHGKESDMSQLTEIPVVAQRTIDLFALFNAFAAVETYDMSFFERDMPGVTEALRAWSASHGHRIEEHAYLNEGHGGYINVTAYLDPVSMRRRIAVMHSRQMTEAEDDAAREVLGNRSIDMSELRKRMAVQP